MATTTVAWSRPAPLPRSAALVLAAAVAVLWLVAFEAGPASEMLGQARLFLHEVFHDGRHLLGVPCH